VEKKKNNMQNKTAYIDFIINELNKGNVKYNDVLNVFLPKFALTRQTFDKYWKLANEAYLEQREAINNAKMEQSIESEKEAVKKAILSKHEALEILSEIAKGKHKKVEGHLVIVTANEQKNAIETMAKLQGWNEATKIQTDASIIFNINERD
jgi:hypothetical protein